MKGRRIGLALLLLAAFGVMTGCGKKETAEDIAVIQEASQAGNITTAMYDAATQYAVENGKIIKQHTVVSAEPDDYMVAIQEAAEAGASCIIGYGEDFEVPLYTMQKKYKKVKFIILDGAPRKAVGKKEKIRKNTVAVSYNEQQAGFLAGYAAVQEGYRSLGFMGGRKQNTTVMYGSGFVQGAEYAASELGLTADEVTVRYEYLGSNEISPSMMAQAASWYEDGCEVIFAGGGSVGTAVMKAAEQSGNKMIASDVELTSSKQAVLTSAIKNVNDLVYNKIDTVFKDKFQGKTKEEMDLTNDGVKLVVDGSQLQNVTVDSYQSIVAKITDGSITVEDKYVSQLSKDGSLSHITVRFQ